MSVYSLRLAALLFLSQFLYPWAPTHPPPCAALNARPREVMLSEPGFVAFARLRMNSIRRPLVVDGLLQLLRSILVSGQAVLTKRK